MTDTRPARLPNWTASTDQKRCITGPFPRRLHPSSRRRLRQVERFASFDGTEIAYTVSGSGPDVLLLHGFAADHRVNWVEPGVVDALVDGGHRVIAYDARGHGASGKPHDPDAYAHDAMPRDATTLLDHLDVTTVDVVGYSMGAMV